MFIGRFQKHENDFIGSIHTLGLTALDVVFEAVEPKNDKAPSYIVSVEGSAVGAAWKKTSGEGRAYLSVKLDGPTFPVPIQCALVKVDDAYHLAWSRPRARPAEDEGTETEF